MSAAGLFQQQHLKDGAVGTPECIAGLLAASAAGRALMASGVFDQATVTDKFAAGSIAVSKITETLIQADGSQAFTADQSLGGFKLTNVSAGVASTDAVNLQQLNDAVQGLDTKASVRLATQDIFLNMGFVSTAVYNDTGGASGRGQITGVRLAGNITIDGVLGANDDRILLKNEGDVGGLGADANGLWKLTQGPGVYTLDRTEDFDSDDEVTANAFVFVEEGTANGDKGFTLTNNDPITIGGGSGTGLTWTVFTTGGTQDLSSTLASGNTTGGTDISLSSGDKITSVQEFTILPTQNPATTGLGYALDIKAGQGGPGVGNSGDGGVGGSATYSAGNGGDVTLPTAGIVSSGAGGVATFKGGDGGQNGTTQAGVNPAGDGGDAVFTGGDGGEDAGNNTPPGDGGNGILKGGDAGISPSKDGDGGNAVMRGGAKRGAGADGDCLIGDQDTVDVIIGNTTDLNDIILRSLTKSYTLTAGADLATTAQTIIEAINEVANKVGTFRDGELITSTQAISGSDTIMTQQLTFTPVAGTTPQLWHQGARLIAGVHYSVAGKVITWLGTSGFPLNIGDNLQIDYRSSD